MHFLVSPNGNIWRTERSCFLCALSSPDGCSCFLSRKYSHTSPLSLILFLHVLDFGTDSGLSFSGLFLGKWSQLCKQTLLPRYRVALKGRNSSQPRANLPTQDCTPQQLPQFGTLFQLCHLFSCGKVPYKCVRN